MLIKAQVVTVSLDTEKLQTPNGASAEQSEERDAFDLIDSSTVWTTAAQLLTMLAGRMTEEAREETERKARAHTPSGATDDTIGEGLEPPAP